MDVPQSFVVGGIMNGDVKRFNAARSTLPLWAIPAGSIRRSRLAEASANIRLSTARSIYEAIQIVNRLLSLAVYTIVDAQ
jgi:hypothetical protein